MQNVAVEKNSSFEEPRNREEHLSPAWILNIGLVQGVRVVRKALSII